MNYWYNVMDKELRIDDENTFSNPRVNTSGIFQIQIYVDSYIEKPLRNSLNDSYES